MSRALPRLFSPALRLSAVLDAARIGARAHRFAKRPSPPARTLLWPLIGVIVLGLLGPAGHALRMPGSASRTTRSHPTAGGPSTRIPQRAQRLDRGDLLKVQRALQALRAVRSTVADASGISLAGYDRAVGDLAAMERSLAGTAEPTAATATTGSPASARPRSRTADVMRVRTVRRAVAYARAQLGKPYIYGGVGPRGYDCSGLMMMAYRAAGLSLPRTSDVQYWHTHGHRVRAGAEQAGDLVFFDYHRGMSGPGHVGMVIDPERHLMIAAPHTGTVVKVQNYNVVGQADGFVGFTRPVGGETNPLPKTDPTDTAPKTGTAPADTPATTQATPKSDPSSTTRAPAVHRAAAAPLRAVIHIRRPLAHAVGTVTRKTSTARSHMARGHGPVKPAGTRAQTADGLSTWTIGLEGARWADATMAGTADISRAWTAGVDRKVRMGGAPREATPATGGARGGATAAVARKSAMTVRTARHRTHLDRFEHRPGVRHRGHADGRHACGVRKAGDRP